MIVIELHLNLGFSNAHGETFLWHEHMLICHVQTNVHSSQLCPICKGSESVPALAKQPGSLAQAVEDNAFLALEVPSCIPVLAKDDSCNINQMWIYFTCLISL